MHELIEENLGDCFAQIQSDLIFRMPCVKLAESLAAGGAQVWTYDFAWESPVKGKSGASLGAAHTVDVPFVFQTCPLLERCGPSERGRRKLLHRQCTAPG
mgnify:CR=1 FL=1